MSTKPTEAPFMNPISLVFAANKAYMLPLAVALQSIYENNQNNTFKVYLLLSGQDKPHENLLKTITKIGFEHEIIRVDESLFTHFHVNGHIGLPAYYRLALAEFLPKNLDKVIYLDADILVLGNLKELWEIDLGSNAFAAVTDATMANFATRLNMPADAAYFNSGVLLVNLTYFRGNKVFEQATTYYLANKERITFHDQDILNGLLHDRWLQLPAKWNIQIFKSKNRRLLLKKDFSQTALVHFLGNVKPWHYGCNYSNAIYFHYVRKTAYQDYCLDQNHNMFIENRKHKSMKYKILYRLGLLHVYWFLVKWYIQIGDNICKVEQTSC